MKRPLSLSLALLLCVGCASPPGGSSPIAASQRQGPLTTSDVLPLTDRYVASFRSRAAGEESSFVLEYFRASPGVAHLVIAGRIQRLLVQNHSVTQSSGGVVLQDPLEVGRTFAGGFGEVRINEVGTTVTVPAGTFDRCVVTREANLELPKTAISTYCADVGLVRLTVEAGGERLETELMSYAPRVDLGSAP